MVQTEMVLSCNYTHKIYVATEVAKSVVNNTSWLYGDFQSAVCQSKQDGAI